MKTSGWFGKPVRVLLVMSLAVMLLPGMAVGAPSRTPSVEGETAKPAPAKPKQAVGIPGWAGGTGGEYVDGQVLVRFAPGVTGTAAARTAHAAVGATVEQTLRAVDGLQLVKLKPGLSVEDAVAAYEALPNVVFAQPNYTVRQLAATPDDEHFDQLWGLNNTGQEILSPPDYDGDDGWDAGVADADIDAPEAWDVTTGSSNIIVAVVDTGVDYNHPDLADNMWVNTAELNGVAGDDDDGNGYVDDIYGYDFINGDSDPWDDFGHGTHCAGTIGAAGNDGWGVVGVNWDVSIMALKIFDASGSTSTAAIVEAFGYADLMGADVISNSWGGIGASDPAEEAAIVANPDALFVCAAGNDNLDTDVSAYYPAGYNYPNLIAVGASNSSDQMGVIENYDTGTPELFSNYGATSVDVFAPGQDIWSTVPPGVTYGWSGSPTTVFEDQFDDLSQWYVAGNWALFGGYAITPPYSVGCLGYGDNEDSWIDATVPLDLSTATHPYVHWRMGAGLEPDYDFVVWGVYDESAGTYQDLGSFTGWTNTAFDSFNEDLSDFIGQDDLYLYFGLTSDESANSADGYLGAFIDDVQVVDLDYAGSTLVDDAFDSASTGWNVYTDSGTAWAWDGAFGYANFGCWKVAPYADNTDTWLDSPVFDLVDGATLRFSYKASIEEDYDSLEVWAYSPELDWTRLSTMNSYSDGWTQAQVSLAAYAGQSDVQVSFLLKSDSSGSSPMYEGVWIDDVRIDATPIVAVADYSDAWDCWDGTSMATPHVAGIAALALAKNPDVAAADLKTAIMGGVDVKPAFSGKCVTGGRVNVASTLASIASPDTDPPTTTLEAVPATPNGQSGWYLSQPSITLTSDEPGTTWYDWGGGPFQYTTTTFPPIGENTMEYWSYDAVDNEETPHNTWTVKWDDTAPSAPTNVAAVQSGAGKATVTWTAASDADSGIQRYILYRWDAGTSDWALVNHTIPATTTSYDVTGLASGLQRFKVTALNMPGLWTDGTEAEVTIDATPPTTTLAVDRAAPNGPDGWYLYGLGGSSTHPQITLTADEAGTTYYQWDSGTVNEYSAAIPMQLGEHRLTYWSEDAVGNEETPHKSQAFKYDNSGPPAPPNLQAQALSPTSVRLTWDASVDNYSGTKFYKIAREEPTYGYIGSTPDAATRTWDVTGLLPATEYTFSVYAEDYATWGGSQSFVTITTPAEAAPAATIENFDAGVTFGRFVTVVGAPAFSGGSYTYAYSKAPYVGTRLEAKFFGDTVRWIGPKQPSYGKANVYIDGVLQGAYDCYAATGGLAETIFEKTGMTDGWHTITIEMRSDKNAASTGYVVVIDKFEVEGADPKGIGPRFSEATGTYLGGWVKVAGNPTYTDSSYAYSYWAGARFIKAFTGTRVAWVGPKVYNYGRAAVYIDGAYKGVVSQYAPAASTQFRAKVWESAVLPAGNHTIEIRPLGTKDAASSGAIVVIDGIDVTP